jgi:hypothetical protein
VHPYKSLPYYALTLLYSLYTLLHILLPIPILSLLNRKPLITPVLSLKPLPMCTVNFPTDNMGGLNFSLKVLKQALADYWFKKLFREIQDQKRN